MKQYHANVKTVIVTISHFTTVILCTNSKVSGYIDLDRSLFITKNTVKLSVFQHLEDTKYNFAYAPKIHV